MFSLKRKTCEENSEDRLNEDQRVRDSSILSQAFKDRQTHYERVRNLLVKAEVFHTDVVVGLTQWHLVQRDRLAYLLPRQLADTPTGAIRKMNSQTW